MTDGGTAPGHVGGGAPPAVLAIMRAAFIRHTGGPEQIVVGELPVPAPAAGEVLVRLQASEVNHVDAFVRSGAYATVLPMPFVVGRDIVGTVVAVGVGVAGFTPGEEVWCNSLGHGGRQGAFAEYCAVPGDRLYRLPPGVAPAEAAAVLHGAGTAHVGLVREAHLSVGEAVFVGGAAGAVGSAVTQLAVAMGAHVVASAAPADADWVRACGADVVIDYHDPQRYARIRAAAPQGVDVWWDTSGHHEFERCLPLLRRGARIVVMAGLAARVELPVGPLYTNDIGIRGFAISNAAVSDLAAAAVAINHLLAHGRLRARIGATFHLADARQAHSALESGGITGRIVVVP